MAITGAQLLLRVFCRGNDQVSVNRVYLECTGNTGTGATDFECATAIEAKIATAYKAALSASADYLGIMLQHIRPGFRELSIPVTTGAGVGGVTGNLMPTQVCGMISARTLFAGRASRGRVYVPFPSVSAADPDGLPTSAYRTLVTAVGSALLDEDTIVGSAGNSTLISILFKKADPVNSLAFTAFTVPAKWGTQHKRGSYGQANTSPF